jgi:hypothetical protein
MLSLRPSRFLMRGASRSSQVSEAGCDGRDRIARRAMPIRTAKACGPGTPGLVLNLRDVSQATVTKRSWTPRRARHKRSHHRAGNVDVSASSAVTTLVCFLHLHTGLRVQPNTRHSLRPLVSLGVSEAKLGHFGAAGMRGRVFPSLRTNGSVPTGRANARPMTG